MSLIRISRQFSPAEQQTFRRKAPKSTNLDEFDIRLRRLGEASTTLVDRGEFGRVISKSAGRLATASVTELAIELNKEVLAQKTFTEHLQLEPKDVNFFGGGPVRSIAYVLDAPELEEEHRIVTSHLDKLNGVNSGWREFVPHISIATIPAANMNAEILDAFWEFSPQTITLLPAKAQAL